MQVCLSGICPEFTCHFSFHAYNTVMAVLHVHVHVHMGAATATLAEFFDVILQVPNEIFA